MSTKPEQAQRRIADGRVRDSHPVPEAPRTYRERLAWGFVVLLSFTSAVLAVWGIGRVGGPVPQTVVRFGVNLPGSTIAAGWVTGRRSIAISPDSRYIVYNALGGSTSYLYLRAIDQLDARRIPGIGSGASDPFFSFDGRWLGFFEDGTLKKVLLAGGAPVTICDTNGVNGASWGADHTIVFADGSGDLYRVSDAGGSPQALTSGNTDEGISYRWPEILPDGRTVLVTDWKGINPETRVVILDLETGEQRILIEGAGYGSYAPSGHVIFVSLSTETAGTLLAAPFDPARPKIEGSAFPVVEEVMLGSDSVPIYATSRDGTLVYAEGRQARTHLVWVDRQGRVESEAELGFRSHPRLSPDGNHVIAVKQGDLWRYDSARKTATRLTFEGRNYWPVWSPDGQWIAYTSDRKGFEYTSLLKKHADGSGVAEELLTTGHSILGTSWSSDGTLLAYSELHPETDWDLWILPLDENASPYPFLKTPFQERSGRFSPDGRFMAYTSDESGRDEIYVRPFPGPGGKWQVSTEGGRQAAWSPTGRELFYRNDDELMAVRIDNTSEFVAEPPRLLFKGNYHGALLIFASYDITPDGERFVLIRGEGGLALQVTLNWFDELERLVPTED